MKSRSLSATTVRIDAELDPVDVGARSGLLWARDDFALAGIGEAARIPLARPGGAESAQQTLSAMVGSDDVQQPGTGPVGFAALAFDRTLDGELIVPELVVGRGREGRRWLTTIAPAGEHPSLDEALERARVVSAPPVDARPDPTEFTLRAPLAPEFWRDQVVGAARDRMVAGQLEKAVFARELRLTTDQPLDPGVIVQRLRSRFGSAILFNINGFVGASPELLVARSGDVVSAHPLAGTAPRGADAATDARLAAGLLASSKDRWEHRITIDWLLDTLLPFCSYVDAEPEPTIVSLANVHHLGTRVEGRLSGPSASILELIEALHPTPAVGGNPLPAALALIDELEHADRGLYAGPTGWLDGAGNGAFAVAIRSAHIEGTEAVVFAGVGVVADSDPASELAETRAKFQATLPALCQP